MKTYLWMTPSKTTEMKRCFENNHLGWFISSLTQWKESVQVKYSVCNVWYCVCVCVRVRVCVRVCVCVCERGRERVEPCVWMANHAKHSCVPHKIELLAAQWCYNGGHIAPPMLRRTCQHCTVTITGVIFIVILIPKGWGPHWIPALGRQQEEAWDSACYLTELWDLLLKI